jgi:glyoxylase-like metal-dependent hydrolase (beta-lactamase superfamily II)
MTLARHHALSRRGFCLCCLFATAGGGGLLAPRKASAELLGIVELIKYEAGKTPITIHRLRGNVSVLEGSGGNVAVLTGPDGKLVVDSGIAVSRPQMETALSALGPQPVTHLINTHWHFDHANGNEWLHELGPEIIAHSNTPRHLAATQRVEDWSTDFRPLSQAALPTVVFDEKKTMRLNDTTIDMAYYGPAHTDSDISVSFAELDIRHTGDTFWNGIYPFIDYSTGGSIDGSIRAADANLEVTTDSTIIIPGHGQPVSNRAQLKDFRDMLFAIRGNVAALKKRGHSLDAIVAAKPTAAFDDRWGRFVIDPTLFTRLVYQGV